MVKPETVGEELRHAWYALILGWRKLYQRAAASLTQFSRHPRKGELQSAEEQELALRSSGWGLLATEVFDADDKIVVRLEVPGMGRDDFDLGVFGPNRQKSALATEVEPARDWLMSRW